MFVCVYAAALFVYTYIMCVCVYGSENSKLDIIHRTNTMYNYNQNKTLLLCPFIFAPNKKYECIAQKHQKIVKQKINSQQNIKVAYRKYTKLGTPNQIKLFIFEVFG